MLCTSLGRSVLHVCPLVFDEQFIEVSNIGAAFERCCLSITSCYSEEVLLFFIVLVFGSRYDKSKPTIGSRVSGNAYIIKCMKAESNLAALGMSLGIIGSSTPESQRRFICIFCCSCNAHVLHALIEDLHAHKNTFAHKRNFFIFRRQLRYVHHQDGQPCVHEGDLLQTQRPSRTPVSTDQ